MSLGIEAAGFNIAQVWETPGYSKNAATWDLNRPHQRHHVLELDHNNTTHFRSLGEVDLIYGNPPCGGVSSMTCSRMGSPTNNCMRQWIRMVAPAMPRMILMENGYQLATDRMSPLLGDLTGVLDHYSYHWWTWMFYSWQLGCPQIRRRMFLCALRSDGDDPIRRPDLLYLNDLTTDKSAGAVWPHLWDLANVAPSPQPVICEQGWAVTQHWYSDIKNSLRRNELLKEHWDLARSSYITMHEYEVAKRKAEQGDKLHAQWLERHAHRLWMDCPREFAGKMHMHRPCRLDWDKPSGAIIGFFKFIHPTVPRFLTMREMARLMGYPDSWQFHALEPHLIAQGIPSMNAAWAADRMLKVAGWR